MEPMEGRPLLGVQNSGFRLSTLSNKVRILSFAQLPEVAALARTRRRRMRGWIALEKPLREEFTPIQCANSVPTRSEAAKLADAQDRHAAFGPGCL
jgi:hypothetical protein